MSCFHLVLGLLAVAVCISFAKGAAFSSILSDQSRANNLHELNTDRPITDKQRNVVQERSFKKSSAHKILSEGEDHQNEDIHIARNTAYNNRAAGFGEINFPRTADVNALRHEVVAADSRSGSIEDRSTGRSGLVSSAEKKYDSGSGSTEESDSDSGDSASDNASLGLQASESQENCEDDGGTGPREPNEETSSPSSSTPLSTAHTNANQDTSPSTSEDDCDDHGTREGNSNAETSGPNKGEGADSTSAAATPSTPKLNTDQDRRPSTAQEDSGEDCHDSKAPSEGSSSETNTQSPEDEEPQSEECEETWEPEEITTSTTTTKTPKKPVDSDGSWSSNSQTDENPEDFSGASDESPDESASFSW